MIRFINTVRREGQSLADVVQESFGKIAFEVVVEVPCVGVVVVDRNECTAAHWEVCTGDGTEARGHELRDAPIEILVGVAARDADDPDGRIPGEQLGRDVDRRVRTVHRRGCHRGRVRVEDRDVRAVQFAFHALQPVGLLDPHRRIALRLRQIDPRKLGKRRGFAASHEHPDDVGFFLRLVSGQLDLLADRLVGRVLHLQAVARGVVEPSVVVASDAFLLYPSIKERCESVGAVGLNDANLTLAVTESDELFAE
ncbi:hypothetical protein D3C71_1330050 [compost metagenome]